MEREREINGTVTIPLADYLKLRESDAKRRELRDRLQNVADSVRDAILADYEFLGEFRDSDGKTYPDNWTNIRAAVIMKCLGEDIDIPREEIDKAIAKHAEDERRRKEILSKND